MPSVSTVSGRVSTNSSGRSTALAKPSSSAATTNEPVSAKRRPLNTWLATHSESEVMAHWMKKLGSESSMAGFRIRTNVHHTQPCRFQPLRAASLPGSAHRDLGAHFAALVGGSVYVGVPLARQQVGSLGRCQGGTAFDGAGVARKRDDHAGIAAWRGRAMEVGGCGGAAQAREADLPGQHLGAFVKTRLDCAGAGGVHRRHFAGAAEAATQHHGVAVACGKSAAACKGEGQSGSQ